MLDRPTTTPRLFRPFWNSVCPLCLVAGFAHPGIAQSPIAAVTRFTASEQDRHLACVLQLGSPKFCVREEAARQLETATAESIEWLFHARNSEDLEIAQAARSLLAPQSLDKAMCDLAPRVAAYVAGDSIQRRRSIEQLARLEPRDAMPCLLAVTRFEANETHSAIAAVELIAGNFDARDICTAVAHSPRAGSMWLRIWYGEYVTENEFIAAWHPMIDRILSDVSNTGGFALPEHLCTLFRLTADRYWRCGESRMANELVRSLGDAATGNPVHLMELYDWLRLRGQNECALEFMDREGTEFGDNPAMACRRAEVLFRIGREEEADQLVSQAARSVGGDLSLAIEVAEGLRANGLGRWGKSILQQALAARSEKSPARVAACRCLSRLYQESGEFRLAAETLDGVTRLSTSGNDDSPVKTDPEEVEIRAQAALCWFLYQHEAGETAAAKQSILAGLSLNPCHSELLVVARSLPVGDEHWSASVDELIELALKLRENDITRLQRGSGVDLRDQLTCRHQLAGQLNSWAWLAARSGKQLGRAESYSRQALEIVPGNADLLDTLAACLNARGRHIEAIAVQQQAVRRAPWNAEIQSGLARYRQALDMAAWLGFFR